MRSSAEVEVKLTAPTELGGDLLRAALATARGVTRVGKGSIVDLDAVYYDTPDLDLATHRVTLRRRSGGADAGWHLKLPGDGFRTEVTESLRQLGDLPPTLVDLVSVFTRGQPLGPVVRIQTTRTAFEVFDRHDRLVAEIADDDVRTQTLGSTSELSAWREVEIELKGAGGAEILDGLRNALVKAGARRSTDTSKLGRALGTRVKPSTLPALPAKLSPRTSAHAIVATYLGTQVTALLEADPAIRADLPDAVHQARVAIRRMRSVLRVFERLLDPAVAVDLDRRLSELSNELGRARDAEVQRERLENALSTLPPELVLGPVAARVLENTRPEEIEAHRSLLETINTAAYVQLIDDLLAFVHATAAREYDRPRATVGADLVPALRRAKRQLQKRANTAGTDDAALHRARKAAKRLRYAAEVLEPNYGANAKRLATEAEQVQEVLGEHQDSVVMRAHLKALAISTRAAANESAFTFGLLYGLELENAERSLQRFAVIWKKSDRHQHRWLG